MSRIQIDDYFIEIAKLVARRATCARRQVGCVLVNEQNHILATGYNGVARGQPHCIDTACPGAHCASGTGLHLCQAIHAEQNALLQCRNITEIYAAYVTASPCVQCLRLLLNTSCQVIVFDQEYPHSESKDLWEADGREWRQYEPPVVLEPPPIELTEISPLIQNDLVQLQFRLPKPVIDKINVIGVEKLVEHLQLESINLTQTMFNEGT